MALVLARKDELKGLERGTDRLRNLGRCEPSSYASDLPPKGCLRMLLSEKSMGQLRI